MDSIRKKKEYTIDEHASIEIYIYIWICVCLMCHNLRLLLWIAEYLMPAHRKTIVSNMFNVQLTFGCYLWSMQWINGPHIFFLKFEYPKNGPEKYQCFAIY